jgi:hypothetical protein
MSFTRPTFESRTTGPTWRGMMPAAILGASLWLGAYYFYKDSAHNWSHFKDNTSKSALDAVGLGKEAREAEISAERDFERYRIAHPTRTSRVVNNPEQEVHLAQQDAVMRKRYIE